MLTHHIVMKERYEVAFREICIAVHKSGSLDVLGLPILNLEYLLQEKKNADEATAKKLCVITLVFHLYWVEENGVGRLDKSILSIILPFSQHPYIAWNLSSRRRRINIFVVCLHCDKPFMYVILFKLMIILQGGHDFFLFVRKFWLRDMKPTHAHQP